jgi:prefoldin subunit 5
MPTPDELLASKQQEAKTLADEYNAGQEEINEKTKSQQELLQRILKITGAIEALQDLSAPEAACEVVSE